MLKLQNFVYGPAGLLLLIVGLAGIPDDTTTWGRWVSDYVPFLQNVWVLMALIGAGALVLSIFWGNLISDWKFENRNPHVKRLKSRSYVSFGEICENVPKDHAAYDYGDVLNALMKAIDMGHFKKLQIVEFNDQGERTGRNCDLTLSDFVNYRQTGLLTTPGTIAFASAQFHAIFRSANAEDFLIVNRSAFRQWYRRFRDHRYER